MLAPIEKCTGCLACFNSCSIGCILDETDEEGFRQPIIDDDRCIKCGKCTQACPVLQDNAKKQCYDPKVYAAWNKDENILQKSSSGGVFGVFARFILEKGGVVFGAAYSDDISVKHAEINTTDELSMLYGSKYVQSNIGKSFYRVREVLEENKYVLFSGTPCQITGLYGFLGGDKYDTLITCDLVCHGVPSPGVFKDYIDYIEAKENAKLKAIEMRTKKRGWMQDSEMKLVFNDKEKIICPSSKDPYMNGFMYSTFLRQSCYNCIYAKTPRESDITLGDFWGIGSDIAFNHKTEQGVSLVLVNSNKGEELFGKCKDSMFFESRTLAEAKKGNAMLSPYQRSYSYRKQFFMDYQKKVFKELVPIYLKRRRSLLNSIKKAVIKIVGSNNAKRIKRIMKK